jgi:uncharacterized membrane protein
MLSELNNINSKAMIKEDKKRSFIKAISWRITGTIDTFILSYFITGKLSYASTISITEVITKIFLYYIHERVWNRICLGKQTYSVSKEE